MCGNIYVSIFNKTQPPVVEDVSIRNAQVHEHLPRQQSSLHFPLARLVRCNRTIGYRGVFIWNQMLRRIDCNCCISVFKRKLWSTLEACQIHVNHVV